MDMRVDWRRSASDAEKFDPLLTAREAALRRESEEIAAEAIADRDAVLPILRVLQKYRRTSYALAADVVCILWLLGYAGYFSAPLPVEAIVWLGCAVAVVCWQWLLYRQVRTPKGRRHLVENAGPSTSNWLLSFAASAAIWGWALMWTTSTMSSLHEAGLLILLIALSAVKVILQVTARAIIVLYVSLALALPAALAVWAGHLRDSLAIGAISSAVMLAYFGYLVARRRDNWLLYSLVHHQRVEELHSRAADLQHRLSITERELRTVKGSDQARKEYLDHLSHDLSQPLTAIGISVKHAQASLRQQDPRGVHEALLNIHATQHSALSVLQNLLRLSRLEAGKHKFVPVWFDPAELLRELDTNFRQLALDRNGLNLRLRSSRSLKRLFADRAMLRQLLSNLLDNAIKYTEEGTVLVTVRKRGGTAQIRVWDTGPGFPESERHLMFEPFWRPERSAKASGTGVGLTIARRIAEGLGSDLRLLDLPRQGAVFELVLPLRGTELP